MIEFDLDGMMDTLDKYRGPMRPSFYYDKFIEEVKEFKASRTLDEGMDIIQALLQYFRSSGHTDSMINKQFQNKVELLVKRFETGYYNLKDRIFTIHEAQNPFRREIHPKSIDHIRSYINSTESGYVMGLIAYWCSGYHVTIAATIVDYDQAVLLYSITNELGKMCPKFHVKFNNLAPFKSRQFAQACLMTCDVSISNDLQLKLSNIASHFNHRKWMPHVTFKHGYDEYLAGKVYLEKDEWKLDFTLSNKEYNLSGTNVNASMVDNIMGGKV